MNENGDTLPLRESLDFLEKVTPSNCFIERSSNLAYEEMEAVYGEKHSNSIGENDGLFGKHTEKWYGVEYFIHPVDRVDVQRWEAGKGADDATLHLPTPNRYIPRSLELCKDLPDEAKVPRIELPIEPPKLVINKPNGE